MFTPFAQSRCHVQTCKSGPLRKHNADDYDSQSHGSDRGTLSYGFGEDAQNWRVSQMEKHFHQNTSPQMGTNAAGGGCGTHNECTLAAQKPTSNSEVCFFCFFLPFCRFTLLQLDHISERKQKSKRQPQYFGSVLLSQWQCDASLNEPPTSSWEVHSHSSDS